MVVIKYCTLKGYEVLMVVCQAVYSILTSHSPTLPCSLVLWLDLVYNFLTFLYSSASMMLLCDNLVQLAVKF